MTNIPLSVLDLSPVPEGSDAGTSLRNSAELARRAEQLGYRRFWMAEHHSMPGIASAATAVALSYVGSQTSTIRIGAGGIMLPNHAPLIIAEQFGTLKSLYPGARRPRPRPRAPEPTRQRPMPCGAISSRTPTSFPQDVVELMRYFADENGRVARPSQARVRHSPAGFWGRASTALSSRPRWACPTPLPRTSRRQMMMEAIKIYRESGFEPSASSPAFM